jgi:hypothetical protein
VGLEKPHDVGCPVLYRVRHEVHELQRNAELSVSLGTQCSVQQNRLLTEISDQNPTPRGEKVPK